MKEHEMIDRVEDGLRRLSEEERRRCAQLLEEAKVIVDASARNAEDDLKEVVMIRMVRRAIGNADMDIPMGATQGAMSGLGYSQSWQMPNGNYGELYLAKADKKILGISDRIGMAHALDVEGT